MADKNMEQVMEKAQVLIEALPYIQRFIRMSHFSSWSASSLSSYTVEARKSANG